MRIAASFVAVWLGLGCTATDDGGPGLDEPDAGVQIEDPGSYDDNLVYRSRMPGSTFIETQQIVARDDGLVFVCTGVQGLRVVDASNPDQLRSLGQGRPSLGHPQFPRCQHVGFEGDTVWITSRGDEIQPESFIAGFDVSASPVTEIASHAGPGRSYEGIVAANGLLYVAMHGDGLAIFEQQGQSLTELGVVSGLTNAWGVAVANTTVYVADGSGGLAVVDASDPSSPSVVGRLDLGGAAQAVELSGSVAYVAAGSAGLIAVDVSNPSSPVVVGEHDTPGSALQVAVTDEGTAFVADWNDIRVFDISDPAELRLVATETIQTADAFSRVLGIGALGNVAYVGEWTGVYAYEYLPQHSAPDLAVAPAQVEFGRVAVGEADATAVIVRNDGTERLVAYDISVHGDAFEVDRDTLYLGPGEVGVLEVVYRPAGATQDTGELVIKSDDPDEADRRVPIVGNRTGFGVGDRGPEVVVRLLGGGQFRSSEHSGKIIVLAYFATF